MKLQAVLDSGEVINIKEIMSINVTKNDRILMIIKNDEVLEKTAKKALIGYFKAFVAPAKGAIIIHGSKVNVKIKKMRIKDNANRSNSKS